MRVITTLLALTLAVEGAHAQPMGGSPVDPPSRVGRVARLLGTVSFRGADQTEWQAAATNYPVTSGNVLWTEPSSAAEIGIGATLIALDQSTEFDVDVLDDRTLQATQPQGGVFLRLGQMAEGDVYRITTPRGAVVLTKAGAYEIVAGDADHPTLVTVVEGAARIDSTSASLTLAAAQTGRIEGASNFEVSVGPAVMDRFVTGRLDAEREIVRNRAAVRGAPPQAVAQMSGGDALANTGTWAASTSYGQIWYPPVQASWVPYRDGHWGYVAPWGWTWIDDAPWGFAPFHYGRWVQDGSRWGWIPRERGASVTVAVAPVYAPALVSFISVGVAVGVALSPGAQRDPRGSVGWVPLGPRETYVPPYRTSDRYVKAVNVSNVTNVTNINTVTNISNVNNMVNRRAATVVPVTAMTASQPVAARRENVTTQALATAQPERAAPVQPTTATVGVTPVVAKELKLAPPATPPQKIAVAPGPVVPPAAAVPVVVQSRPAAPVVVAPGALPGRPNAPAMPNVAPVVPAPVAVTLPVLRAPTPETPAHPQAGRAPGAAGPAAPVPGVPGARPGATSVIVAPVVPVAPVIPTPKALVPTPVPPAPTPPVATPPQPAKPITPPVDARPTPRANPAVEPAKPLVPTPPQPARPITPPVDARPIQRASPASEPAKPVVPVTPNAQTPIKPTTPPPGAPPGVPAPAPTKPVTPPADARPNQRVNPTPEAAKPAVPVPPPATVAPKPIPVPVPPVAVPVVPPARVTPPAPPIAVPSKVPVVEPGKDPETKPKP